MQETPTEQFSLWVPQNASFGVSELSKIADDRWVFSLKQCQMFGQDSYMVQCTAHDGISSKNGGEEKYEQRMQLIKPKELDAGKHIGNFIKIISNKIISAFFLYSFIFPSNDVKPESK